MIARGFKPVGWVAAVAGSALGCYMLSLNVASERAELAKVERQIIAAKQDIRSLQTELGTRGRLQQLEHWNADVLALSAPSATQFMPNAFKLASFSQPQESIEDKAQVRMASAEIVKTPAAKPAISGGFTVPGDAQKPVVRRASFVVPETSPLAQDRPAVAKAPVAVKPVPVKMAEAKPVAAKPATAKATTVKSAPKKAGLIDSSLAKAIGDAEAAEKKAGGAGTQ